MGRVKPCSRGVDSRRKQERHDLGGRLDRCIRRQDNEVGIAYVAVPLLLFPLLLLLLLVLPAHCWHVGVPPIPLLFRFVHCFIRTPLFPKGRSFFVLDLREKELITIVSCCC